MIKRFAGTSYRIIKLVMGKYAPRIQATMIKCVNTDQSDKTKALALQCLDKLDLSKRTKLHESETRPGFRNDNNDDDEEEDIKMHRGVDSAALPSR